MAGWKLPVPITSELTLLQGDIQPLSLLVVSTVQNSRWKVRSSQVLEPKAGMEACWALAVG